MRVLLLQLVPVPSACLNCSAPAANDWRHDSFWRDPLLMQAHVLKPDALRSHVLRFHYPWRLE